ncbi:MAG: multiprotein bridging factor aMBF1 [Candidatus Nanohalobium sp.]
MPKCQLCGEEVESTTKAKIEGAVMQVCDSCAEMGEKIDTKSRKKKKRKKRRNNKSKTLANDYGSRVRNAREDRELSIKELADSLNEKTSVIKKVEREELKPDKSLAGKLSKELDITLYVNPEVTNYDDTSDSDSRKATLGDVANVKK